MRSFWIDYDAMSDTLEVRFAPDSDDDSMLSLNDHVHVAIGRYGDTITGVRLEEYARMLRVSETEFSYLGELPDDEVAHVLRLMSAPPVSLFFDVTDPVGLIARVAAPSLEELVGDL